MRIQVPALTWILLLGPVSLAAQGAPTNCWVLGVGGEAIRFSGGVTDTAATDETGATLRPNGRLGIRLALARAFGSWEAGVELGWATGHVAGSNDRVSIEDRTSHVNRYRFAVSAGVRLLRVGPGGLVVAAGPTVDRWTLDGDDRWRVGGEARIALRLPLGRAELENRVTFGISGSPVTASDAGEGFTSGGLRFLSFGAGLRFVL